MTNIFLTGASGYIGGQTLYELASGSTQYSITALVRDGNQIKTIAEKFPKVKTVHGDLDNAALLESEVAKADIVLNLGSNSHIKSIETILKTLQKRQSSKPAYWVQVSGASVLAAEEIASNSHVPGSPSSVVFDDIADAGRIRDLIRAHSFRAVDNFILDVAAKNPGIKTALVFPPIIYGQGDGPINQRSIQIPVLSKVTIEKGYGLRVGQGLSRWGSVHIKDLGKLFAALAHEASQKKEPNEKAWGEEGLYLSGVRETAFGDVSQKVLDAAKDQGLVKPDAPIKEVNKPEADEVLPKGSVFYGTNARSKSRRGKELLGWAPQDTLDAEIPKTVAEEARRLKAAL